MQNRYVGDVGDFGKYGLLKALARDDLRLGVVWYLNPDAESNNDGKRIGYLKSRKLRPCDCVLFDKLEAIVDEDDRNVEAIRRRAILPAGTSFFETPLTFRDRALYNKHANKAVSDADLVFLDPDNGLECRSARPLTKRGQKYVYFEEITPYLESGKSVLVYHHSTRKGHAQDQVEAEIDRLSRLPGATHPWAFVFKRQSVRFYFCIPTERDRATLLERSRQFLSGPWGLAKHFVQIGLPQEAQHFESLAPRAVSEDWKTEAATLQSGYNRHDKWIRQLADKIGVKLED